MSEEPTSAAPCSGCGKPAALCVCAALAPYDNRHFVLILRHPREAKEALGSAMIAHRQLPNSRLVTGMSWPNLKRALGREADPKRWGVLYLGPAKATPRGAAPLSVLDKAGAINLDQDAVLARLDGIVALDGNWSQAKTLWWRNPWLLKLHRLAIAPNFRSAYGQLRREPRRQAVATIEAIAVCVAALENDPALVAQITRPFHLLLDKYRDATPPRAKAGA
jgi:DTW domain-containing protein YfiP